MKAEDLRNMSKEQLKNKKKEIVMELMKETAKRKIKYSYGKTWHPPFSEWRKDIARIETILREKKKGSTGILLMIIIFLLIGILLFLFWQYGFRVVKV